VLGRRSSSRRSGRFTSRLCSPNSAASMKPSGTPRPPCGSVRWPIIPTRCTPGCSLSASRNSVAGISRARAVPSSGASTSSYIAAALSAAYSLTGRADEAHALVNGAVEGYRRHRSHGRPALILLCAGMTCLSAGQIDEAVSHAREARALTCRLGARGAEAHALCLNGDIAAAVGADDAEGYYRQTLALAEPRGMRPLVAHCHLGLGKLHRRASNHAQT